MSSSIRSVSFSLNVFLFKSLRRFSSRIAVELEDGITKKIENNEMNPRQHPGITKCNRIDLPMQLQKSLRKIVGDYPEKKLLEDCKQLNVLLGSRHPPPEQNDIDTKMARIMDEFDAILPKEKVIQLNEDDRSKWQTRKEQYIRKKMKQRIFAWKPIKYGHYESIVYAIGRGALEYGVLMRIFQEIIARDSNFKPQSYFDFGSGVGTGMWAASSVWKESIIEYFNVDSSRFMNELSELILRDGNENQQMSLKSVFYRQFLPGLETKYNVVVSAFTLFELESSKSRLEIIMNLWKKCDDYLIIVEEGTRRGFQLVNEARNLILSLEGQSLKGHVFAPCPHDNICPRISNEEDRTPCNFEIRYCPTNLSGAISHKLSTARYTYIVLKKGLPTDPTKDWPRLVRPTLVRSKHSICRMCTSDAKLTEVIFTQSKHGRPAYRCARASRWGDRLPISIAETVEK